MVKVPSEVKRQQLGREEPNVPDYYDPERLDGWKGICRFLGIGKSQFYDKLRWDMDAAGIIFYRKRGKVKQELFTYKRLVMNFMIKRRRI